MGTLQSAVAAEVRAEMARRRFTGVELAAHLNLAQQSVSKRLSGGTPIDLDELSAIAQWLGLDVLTLIERARDAEAVA